MLVQREARRDSNIFPPPRLYPDDMAPHGKTIDKYTSASQHQRHTRSVARGKEPPCVTPVKVVGYNRGSKRYVAPKVNEVSEVCPPSYHEAVACLQNVQRPPRVIPPRMQAQSHPGPLMVQPNLSLDQSPFPKQLRVEPLMGQPNPSLDHSPFPKQLGIPVSSTTGPRPHTINNAESTRQYSSPLLPCHNPRSPEPELDIKAALSAQGIHIGIPLSTPHLQSPTDQVEPRLHVNKHTLPTGPTPPTPAALMSPHVDDPCVQKESPRPLRDNPDVKMRALSGPNAPPEPPKRPPGLQSPAVRSGTLVPALSVRVSLPPPSKAKEMTRNVQSAESSGPEILVVGVETVTIKPDAPETPISPITSSSVKLPSVQERLQPSSLTPTLKESSAPMQSNAATEDTPSSSSSGEEEMCRNWFFGVCDNECHYAHRIIPSNRTCHLWLYRKNCTRQQCPFAHGRQSYNRPVRNQPPVRDSDTQHDMPRDSTPLASSGTSRSAESIAPVPLAMKACDARGPSRVASNNGLSECTRKLDGPRLKEVCRNWLDGRCKNAPCHRLHERPTDDVSSDGPRPKEVCRNWLDGRCKNAPCPHLHERPADDNASKTNSPSSSSSSSCPVVQNTHVNDPPAPRSPHPTQKTVISNSVSRNPPPGLPSPMLKTNVSSSSSSIVRNTHVDRTPAPRNPQPAQKTVISNSVSRNPPPGLPSPALKTNAPTSSSSSTVIVRNMHVGGALASRDPHPAQKTVISNSVSRNPPPGLPSPMVKANAPSSSGSSPAIVRNTHVDRASAPRNPNPAQKTVTSNSVSRNPPPGIPSPPTRRNDDFVIPVTISDHIIVKLRNGFEVQDVTTGFETRWVHIGDVSPSTKEPQIRSLLESFGQVDELFISDGKDGKRSAIKAQFSTAAQAMKASMDLQGRQFQGRRLTAKLTLNTTARGTTVLRDTTVRITWTAPQRVGYAGYATLDEAKVAIATATGFVMKDNVLTAALYEGLPAVGAYSVMFSHLPSDAERKDLEQFGNAESIVFERPNYQSPDNARQTVVRMLRSCGNLSNLDLALPIWKGTVLAWATFETHADASNARDYLDGQYPRAMGGKIYISARHVQSLNFTLPLSQFKMLEGDITRLRWSWRTRFHHDVTIADRLPSPDGPVYIRISAENLSNLGIAKAEFEQLQHGEVVTLQKKPIWDRFFAHPAGQSFLRELESRYPGIVLRTRMGKILLLGPIGQRQLARRDIMTRFEELQARHRWPIPLSGKMVGPFVGADLLTLQKSLGPENCYVQQLSNQRVLVVRGNEQAYRIACEAVEKVQSRYTNSSTPSPQSVCPVCFTEASVPTLLNCGHSWCTSCLEGYLMSAVENKTFPLTCLGDDASCTERISLLHAKKILSGDDFAALCEASFWSHVHVRTDEFHHCPTPDCAQVYRATPASAILQCPSCLVRICSGCHAEAHDGLTCEERDVAEDKLFHEWTATHDVKNCPGCKTPIERSEGCNHMTCTRCQTHICWECLATFPKGDGIYDHMRHKHGGIGLDFL